MTEAFKALSRSLAAGWQYASLPIITIRHPMGGLSPDEARKRLDDRLDLIARALTEGAESLAQPNTGSSQMPPGDQEQLALGVPQASEPVEVDDSLGTIRAVNDLFYSRGWTDGLPIIPPVEAEVERFLNRWGRDPNSVVTVVPPQNGLATLEKIAINMVMAGCEPEYLPVIEAALLAMSDERFCFVNSITGTGMQSPLIIVSGPIRNTLGLNSGANAYSPGWRANAAIGRAVRLIILNIGGSIPGTHDRSTQGHPVKNSYVLVENEESSPWLPLHTDYGMDREDSAVTVVTGQLPYSFQDTTSTKGLGILHSICNTMATPNSAYYNRFGDQVLVLCPEHAATLAGDGFGKDEIRQYVLDNARVPITRFGPEFIEKVGRFRWAKRFSVDDPTTMIPILERPEDLIIVVAGGPGKHSSFIPTYPQSRRVTRKILA